MSRGFNLTILAFPRVNGASPVMHGVAVNGKPDAGILSVFFHNFLLGDIPPGISISRCGQWSCFRRDRTILPLHTDRRKLSVPSPTLLQAGSIASAHGHIHLSDSLGTLVSLTKVAPTTP